MAGGRIPATGARVSNPGSLRSNADGKGFLPTDPLGRDKPGEFVRHQKLTVENSTAGSSSAIAAVLRARNPQIFMTLVNKGIGTTEFGNSKADRFSNNNFDVNFPEEKIYDISSLTYHKYGVLTYLGPVDASKGITKQFVVTEVLEGRYSYPGLGIVPVKANFTGPSSVYAVTPISAGVDALTSSKNLDDPTKYTYRIGVIEQARVPDGVLNITREDHDVYPGTIRRTALEVDGQLFIYTSGAGINRYHNSGTGLIPFGGAAGGAASLGRAGGQIGVAAANDAFGAQAFRTLDQQAVKYVNSIRNKAK